MRTSMMPQPPEGLHLPTNIDWINKKATMNGTVWHWKKEGDENLLYTLFNESTWKMDKSRGLLRETEVIDYAVHFLRKRGEWDPDAEWVTTVSSLSIDEHIKTMEVFSKYIDSSMSKTVNLPKDYRFNAFKKLYIDAYETGTIKGVTTYREGTMAYVLSNIDKPAEIVPSRGAPPRPKKLPCDIHIINFKRVVILCWWE
jgi:ribonucleoside-diphosphate reductase alpha chain